MPMPPNYVYPTVDHAAILAEINAWMAANSPASPVNIVLATIPSVDTVVYALDSRGAVRMVRDDAAREMRPVVDRIILGLTPEQAAQREADAAYFHRVADAITPAALAAAGWPDGVGFGGPDVEAHLMGEAS